MYANILKARLYKSDDPKKKRKYKFVVSVPAEKLTGWQEVVMDIGKISASLDAARQARSDKS